MKIEEVIARYIELRDKKAQMAKEFDEALAPLTDKMNRIEAWLQAQMQEQGVSSFSTAAGTAFQSTATSVKLQDKSAFFEFVHDSTGDIDDILFSPFLDVRANKTAVQEFMEANNSVPPGLDINRVSTVSIRRK